MKNFLFILIPMMMFIGTNAQIPTNGLVLEYTFDGGSTLDGSGNGNDSPTGSVLLLQLTVLVMPMMPRFSVAMNV